MSTIDVQTADRLRAAIARRVQSGSIDEGTAQRLHAAVTRRMDQRPIMDEAGNLSVRGQDFFDAANAQTQSRPAVAGLLKNVAANLGEAPRSNQEWMQEAGQVPNAWEGGSAAAPEMGARFRLEKSGRADAFTLPTPDALRLRQNLVEASTNPDIPTARALPAGPLPGQTREEMDYQDYRAENPVAGGHVGRFIHGLAGAVVKAGQGVAGATAIVMNPMSKGIMGLGQAAGVLNDQDVQDINRAVDRNISAQGFRMVTDPEGTAGFLGSMVGQGIQAVGLAGMGLSEHAVAAILSGQSFTQGYQQAKEAGADPTTAYTVGFGYAAAEYLGERVGLDAMLKVGNTRGYVNGMKELLRAAGVNAGEEFVTQVMQNATDRLYRDVDLGEGTGMAALGGAIGGVAGGVGAKIHEQGARSEMAGQIRDRRAQLADARQVAGVQGTDATGYASTPRPGGGRFSEPMRVVGSPRAGMAPSETPIDWNTPAGVGTAPNPGAITRDRTPPPGGVQVDQEPAPRGPAPAAPNTEEPAPTPPEPAAAEQPAPKEPTHVQQEGRQEGREGLLTPPAPASTPEGTTGVSASQDLAGSETERPASTSAPENLSERTQAEPSQRSTEDLNRPETPVRPAETSRSTVPSTEAGPSSTVPAGASGQEPVYLGIHKPSGKKFVQRSNDIDTLESQARASVKKLDDLLHKVGTDVGIAGVKPSRAKERPSILRKLAKHSETGRPVGTFSDLLGGRVAIRSVAQADQMVGEFARLGHPVIDDENFLLHRKESENGYRARHVQIDLGDITAEVELVPEPLFRIQETGHILYDVTRVLHDKAKKGTATDEEVQRLADLGKIGGEWNDAAWAEFEGKGPAFNVEPEDALKLLTDDEVRISAAAKGIDTSLPANEIRTKIADSVRKAQAANRMFASAEPSGTMTGKETPDVGGRNHGTGDRGQEVQGPPVVPADQPDVAAGGDVQADGGGGRGGRKRQPGKRAVGRVGEQQQPDAGTGDTPVSGTQPGGEGQAGSDGAEPGRGTQRPGRPDRVELKPEDRNHVIAPGDVIAPKTPAAKFKANLDAVNLLRTLEKEDRNPTPEEKKILAQYTGWGWAGQYFDEQATKNAKFYDKLKDVMSPEEFASARRSTINAHYTAAPVISSMWEMVRRAGFTGGSVLEPAGGVGHFFGLMPQDLAEASRLHGVELDDISGRIFGKLYPQAKIDVKGYQDTRIPNNSVDLAISNVPFGSYTISGKDYKDLLIHDYFFARSLDKVRPGGLVAFITSDGTLDKLDRSTRELLAQKGDLVAAYRLPNDAFQENAGTAVTTDIIILRKKDGQAFPGAQKWIDTKEVGRWPLQVLTDKIDRQIAGARAKGDYEKVSTLNTQRETWVKEAGKGDTVPIYANEYYADHPENALGKHSLAGTMYTAGDYALVSGRGQDLEADLKKAVERTPENVMGAGKGGPLTLEDTADLKTGERQGSYVIRGGEFKRVMGEEFVPADWLTVKNTGEKWADKIDEKTRQARIAVASDWIKLRTAARALFDAENRHDSTAADLAPLRETLNKVYDAYVKKHGTLTREQPHNEKANFLRDDDDYPLLQSMEKEVDVKKERTRKGVKVMVGAKEWVKGDIFTKRIRAPKAMPTKAANVDDAIGISLGYRNVIDPDLVAQLRGMTPEDAKAQILKSGRAFENPVTGNIETKERYLSGNVRRKLDEARKAAEENEDYAANVAALEAVQPARVLMGDIDFNLASRWIPQEVTSAFAQHILGGGSVRYAKGANAFAVIEGGRAEEWSTERMSASQILNHALNGTSPRVTDRVPGDTPGSFREVLNKDATVAAQQVAQKMQREFTSWVKTAADPVTFRDKETLPRDVMEQTYNEVNNSIVPAQYDGSYLALPGLNENQVRRLPHRMSIVARVLQEGSAVMAHGVGSGKTYSQIVLAMEMRRLGLAKKPMIVVQKATIGDFSASFRKAYPDARILVATEKTFSAPNRKRLMAQIAMGDYDAVIVTQPQFDRLENDPRTLQSFINTKVAALRQAIREEADRNGRRSPTVKQLEQAEQTLLNRLQTALETAAKRKDRAVYFEELGVDAMLIDEAHAYKRMQLTTRMTGVKGIPTGNSQRALGLELKAQQIQSRNGGKNVILSTGTPITNTMAEAYIMLKLATPNVLREYNIDTFDDFAHTFGTTQTKLEMTWSNTWKMVTRFNKFTNGAELVAMIRAGFDVKMGNKELGLKVPDVEGGKPALVKVSKTEGGQQLDDWFMNIANIFEGMTARQRAESSWVPITVMQAGMAAALDPRLIDPTLPDDPGSKVNVAADRIADLYQKFDSVAGTQLVFADRFKPMNTSVLDGFASRSQDVELTAEDLDSADPEDADEQDDVPEGGESAQSKRETEAYKAAGFNLYKDLKQKLIDRGIPADEIAIIHEHDTEPKRNALFEAVKRGDVRVLIGSTEKMGVGVNVQNRLVALHHLDPPRMLTPAMMEQRNGRGIRQGNELLEADPNFKITILNYGTERSMDTAIYQKLEDKGRMLAQVLSGKGVGRTFDDAAGELSAVMAEFKASLTGDARVMRKLELESVVSDLRAQKSAFENEQGSKLSRAVAYRNAIVDDDRNVSRLRRAADAADKALTDPDKLHLKVGTLEGEGAEQVGKMIDAMVAKTQATIEEDVKKGASGKSAQATGTLNRYDLRVKSTVYVPTTGGSRAVVDIALTEGGSPVYFGGATTGPGFLRAMPTIGEGLRTRATEAEQKQSDTRKKLKDLESQLGKEWDKDAELDAAEKELAKIDRALEGKPSEEDLAEERAKNRNPAAWRPRRNPGSTLTERVVNWLVKTADDARERRRAREGRMMSGPPLDDIIDLGIEIGARMLAKGITRGPTLTKLINEGITQRGGDLVKFASRVRRVARRIIKAARGLNGKADPHLLEVAVAREQARKERLGSAPKRDANAAAGVTAPRVSADYRTQLTTEQRAAALGYREGIRTGMRNIQAGIPFLIQKAQDAARIARLRHAIETRAAAQDAAQRRQVHQQAVGKLRDSLITLIRKNLPPQIRLPFVQRAQSVKTIGQYMRVLRSMQEEVERRFRSAAAKRLTRTVGKMKKLRPVVVGPPAPKAPVQHSPYAKFKLNRLGPEYRAVADPIIRSIQEDKRVPDLGALADLIEAKAAAGKSNAFTPAQILALRNAGPRDLKDKNLRPETVTLLDQALRHLARLSLDEHKAVIGDRARDREADAQQVVADLTARHSKDVTPYTNLGPGGQLIRSMGQFFGNSSRDLSRLLSVPAGREGPLWSYGYENLARGESRALALAHDGYDAMEAVVKKHGLTDARLRAMQKTPETIALPRGREIRLTPAQRLDFAGLWSDEDNRATLLRSGVILDENRGRDDKRVELDEHDVAAILATVTPVEQDLLDAFKGFTNGQLRAAGNRAAVLMDGFERFTRNGHYSRARDMEQGQTNLKDMHGFMQTWLEDLGILKERSGGNKPLVLRNFFRFADQHIDKMARYAHLAQPIREMLMLIGHKDVRTTAIRLLGQEWTDEVMDRLQHASGLARRQTGSIATIMRRLVGNTAVSALWMNPSSVAMQKLSYGLAMAHAQTPGEATRMAGHAANPITWADRSALETLRKHSGYFRDRYGSGRSRLVDPTQHAAHFGASAYEKIKEAGMVPLEVMDQDVAIGIYKAKRVTVREEHPGWTADQVDAEAAWRTEMTVRDVNNATSDLDLSGVGLIGKVNPFAAMWTLFSSAGNKVRNNLEEAYANLRAAPDRRTAARLLAVIIAALATLGIGEAVREFLRRQRAGFKDEKNPRDWIDHARNMAAEAAQWITPGSDSVVRAVFAKARGKPVLTNPDTFGQRVADVANGNLSSMAEVLGIPGSAPFRSAVGIYKATQPEEATPWSFRRALGRVAALEQPDAALEADAVDRAARYLAAKPMEKRREAAGSLVAGARADAPSLLAKVPESDYRAWAKEHGMGQFMAEKRKLDRYEQRARMLTQRALARSRAIAHPAGTR